MTGVAGTGKSFTIAKVVEFMKCRGKRVRPRRRAELQFNQSINQSLSIHPSSDTCSLRRRVPEDYREVPAGVRSRRPSASGVACWRDARFTVVRLSKVWRQSEVAMLRASSGSASATAPTPRCYDSSTSAAAITTTTGVAVAVVVVVAAAAAAAAAAAGAAAAGAAAAAAPAPIRALAESATVAVAVAVTVATTRRRRRAAAEVQPTVLYSTKRDVESENSAGQLMMAAPPRRP